MVLEFLDTSALAELGVDSGLDRARLLGIRSRLPGAGGPSITTAQAIGPTQKEEELAEKLQMAREAEAAALMRAAEAAEQAAESSAALQNYLTELRGQDSGPDPHGFWRQGQEGLMAAKGEKTVRSRNPNDQYVSHDEEQGHGANTTLRAVDTGRSGHVSQADLIVSDSLVDSAAKLCSYPCFCETTTGSRSTETACWIDVPP